MHSDGSAAGGSINFTSNGTYAPTQKYPPTQPSPALVSSENCQNVQMANSPMMSGIPPASPSNVQAASGGSTVVFNAAGVLPGSAANFANVDVDVTVMAYAQWLSEMKQQATNARFQQKAELELMREAMSVNTAELNDFKRQYSGAVQQLQSQVSEVRTRLQDVVAESAAQTRQRSETEIHHKGLLDGLNEALNTRSTHLDSGRRTVSENVERIKDEVSQLASIARQAEQDIAGLRKAVGGGQEQTIMKFGEVEQALNVFRNGFTTMRKELSDTKHDWKKGQDLLGQAISTLSQDFADFQKHSNTVSNKLQSDVSLWEETGRQVRDRGNRTEAQLAGLQQSVYDTANEMILIRGDGSEDRRTGARPTSSGALAQRRTSSPSAPARPFGVDVVGPGTTVAGGGQANAKAMEPSAPGMLGGNRCGSSSALDIEAFSRPLSPLQDPRLARSVQKRVENGYTAAVPTAMPPQGGIPMQLGATQVRSPYGFSRSPSPSQRQVLLH